MVFSGSREASHAGGGGSFSSQLEIIDETPDLGVTSYSTDADGNVVFGPNTPKEKRKTTVTGTTTRKGERAETWQHGVSLCHQWDETFTSCSLAEAATKTLLVEKVEDKDREMVADEPEASDPEQTKDGEEETADQSEASEQQSSLDQ